MNLIKAFREELYTSIIMFIVFSYDVYIKNIDVKNSWAISLVFLIIIWAIFYFIFIRLLKDLKLDEREMLLYMKIGYFSFFLFISSLLILFTYHDSRLPFLNVEISKIWGRYILPIFLFIHSITGLIYIVYEEKTIG